MTIDREDVNMRRYEERFGDLPDSRMMADEDIDRMPELIAEALARNRPISNEDVAIWTSPDSVTI